MNKKYNNINNNITELDSASAANYALSAGLFVNPSIDAIGYANAAPTFSRGDGKVTTAIGTGGDYGRSVLVQADGKIVVGGYSLGSNNDFAIARYNSNGSLDTSFNSTGKTTYDFAANNDFGYAVALQTDNKILIAGYSYNGVKNDFAIARYLSNGTFEGAVTTSIGSIDDRGQAVLAQSDGKMVVAGYSVVSGVSLGDFAVVRYNNDGSLDTSFDVDGKVTTTLSDDDKAYAIVTQTDGKLVVVGSSYNSNGNNTGYDFALVRYNTDGSLDTSFDVDGKVSTAVGSSNDYGQSVIMQNDGKIVVAGYSQNGTSPDFSLVRYNSDGSLDTSFDVDGKVITSIGAYDDYGQSVTMQTDGKFVVAGISSNGTNYDVALARYNTDGSLDTSFDGDGKLTTAISVPDTNDRGYSVAVQNDGRIVVAGTHLNGSGEDFAVVRYNIDGSLDLSFNSVNTLNGSPTYAKVVPVVLDSTVQIYDPDLASQGNYSGASITLARNGAANAEDIFSGSGNLSFLGSDVVLSSVIIGTVSNTGGTLAITFNTDAIQARVDETLSSIAYANNATVSPTSVQIDWTFNDGNTGGQGSGGALSALGSTVVAINNPPTLTAFSDNIIRGYENAETPITFANLQTQGDEADVDGTVDAFVIKAVSTGSLKIGTSAGTATAWAAGTNDLVDATHNIYWTPPANTEGSLNAFTAVAKDNGGAESATAIQAKVAVTPFTELTDFNGDGNSDLFWTNSSNLNGSLSFFIMNGLTPTVQNYISYNADGNLGQVINTKGDYNGDGNTDLLWWNSSTSSATITEMNGSTIASQAAVDYAQNKTGWTIADSSADFNADGKSDTLWWNSSTNTIALYLQNGFTSLSNANITPSIDLTGWTIKSAGGDYNGDGHADILLTNAIGSIYMLNMNGTTIASQGYVYEAGPNSWGPSTWTVVEAKGDFNGDGNSDILLRDTANGLLWQFQMNGTTITNGGGYGENTGALPLESVVIDGSSDFNGDHKSDILTRNTSDSSSLIWLMDGPVLTNGAMLGPYSGVDGTWVAQNAHNDVNGDGKADLLWTRPDGAADVFLVDGALNPVTVTATSMYGPYTGWSITNADPTVTAIAASAPATVDIVGSMNAAESPLVF